MEMLDMDVMDRCTVLTAMATKDRQDMLAAFEEKGAYKAEINLLKRRCEQYDAEKEEDKKERKDKESLQRAKEKLRSAIVNAKPQKLVKDFCSKMGGNCTNVYSVAYSLEDMEDKDSTVNKAFAEFQANESYALAMQKIAKKQKTAPTNDQPVTEV